MGLFDFIDDAVDAAFELPGKVVEKAAETVTRLPEIPIRAAQGLVEGVEKGVEKIEKALE